MHSNLKCFYVLLESIYFLIHIKTKLKYYDLHIQPSDLNELERTVSFAKNFGFEGICLAYPVGREFKKFTDEIGKLSAGIEIFIGGILNGSGDARKESRKVLKDADIVLVDTCENNNAPKTWEVDVLCRPEHSARRDFMDQKDSGIDHVMAKLMAERCIGMEINFADILNSSGVKRAMIMGRMRQNVHLARKYDAPVIITSNARNQWEMRAPGELVAIGKALGMTDREAKNALSKNPRKIIKKADDRKNPDVIMRGLEVVKWGQLKPCEKRMWGWY